jgi:hypothetical protein
VTIFQRVRDATKVRRGTFEECSWAKRVAESFALNVRKLALNGCGGLVLFGFLGASRGTASALEAYSGTPADE